MRDINFLCFIQNFRFKGNWISRHNWSFGFFSKMLTFIYIAAFNTSTVWSTSSAIWKAFTIKFKTLCLFTVARLMFLIRIWSGRLLFLNLSALLFSNKLDSLLNKLRWKFFFFFLNICHWNNLWIFLPKRNECSLTSYWDISWRFNFWKNRFRLKSSHLKISWYLLILPCIHHCEAQ